MVAFALAGMRAALPAQDTSLVAPGDPVRVTIPRHGLPRSDYYYFIGFRGDSVVLWNEKHDTSVAVVPFSAIKRFDVNHGDQPPRSQAKMGALVGAGAGLVVGVTESLLNSCDTDVWICDDASVIVGFTVFGALTGAIFGAFNPAPAYKPVALRPRVAVRPLPGGRVGFGLQLAIQP